jgi:hypothetical protein
MMLFGGEFEGAPVVNGVTLVAKTAEMAIKLRKHGMFHVSRRSNYVHPPDKALKEFLEQDDSRPRRQECPRRPAQCPRGRAERYRDQRREIRRCGRGSEGKRRETGL